jgi:hypothetical protein
MLRTVASIENRFRDYQPEEEFAIDAVRPARTETGKGRKNV